MSYMGTGINNSPVIAGTAGADIQDGSFLAVSFDENGNLILPGDAGIPVGLLIAETGSIQAGNGVTVQIKDIGMWKTGGAVTAGAFLSSDAGGNAVVCAPGKFALAVALEAANGAGDIIRVQICKSGYVPASAPANE